MADTSLALSIQAARTINVGRGAGGSTPVNPPSEIPPNNVPYLASPEYEYFELFEGAKNGALWTKDAWTIFGDTDPTDSGNKVLNLRYSDSAESEGGAAEASFYLPIDAVQVEMGFREYIPASYTSANTRNHKTVGFHSGSYGITSSNISVKSECWPLAGGASPSLYSGYDGVNQGHVFPGTRVPLWTENQGAWHDVHVLVELATAPGEYGRYRLWKNGTLILDSDDPTFEENYDSIPGNQLIGYSTRGNFLRECRLAGYVNIDDGGQPLFPSEVNFLYDNFYIRANSAFGSIGGE